MDAASSTAADLATATVPSPSATATSIASNFSWISISEVFWITILYIWYMFLFLACFAIIVGGIWLVAVGAMLLFQLAAKHVPVFYSSSKERLEAYWEASRERRRERSIGRTTQGVKVDEVQMNGFENGEENEVRSKFGRETV